MPRSPHLAIQGAEGAMCAGDATGHGHAMSVDRPVRLDCKTRTVHTRRRQVSPIGLPSPVSVIGFAIRMGEPPAGCAGDGLSNLPLRVPAPHVVAAGILRHTSVQLIRADPVIGVMTAPLHCGSERLDAVGLGRAVHILLGTVLDGDMGAVRDLKSS